MSDAAPPIGHNRPPVDPENLIDPETIADILAENYPRLRVRFEALSAACERWVTIHTTDGKRTEIIDAEDNGKTSDFIRQLSTFAAANRGELDAVRVKVKAPVLEAGKRIDGWFREMAEPLQRATQMMTDAQTSFMRAEAARERAKREDDAAEAKRKEEEALREAARNPTDEDATDRYFEAEAKADVAAARTIVADKDLVRQRTALGTTTTLADNWTFEVLDIRALARAVADGLVPVQFMMATDGVIRAAIRAKQNPLREVPGLRIFNDQQVRRTGR